MSPQKRPVFPTCGRKLCGLFNEEGGGDAGTDAYQFVDATLHAEGVNLSIEGGIRHTALKDVAEDEGGGHPSG